MHSFNSIQAQVATWAARNFGHQPSWQPLLGLQEEVGELSHAVLKRSQGIRGYDDEAKAKAEIIDAVGDIVVYLAAFCTREGLNLGDCVRVTWEQVKERDWTRNALDGDATRVMESRVKEGDE